MNGIKDAITIQLGALAAIDIGSIWSSTGSLALCCLSVISSTMSTVEVEDD